MSRPFEQQVGQSVRAPVYHVPTQEQTKAPVVVLHQADPKILRAKELEKTLGEFGGVVKNFSLYEVAMSGLGVIATKADADWVAYFGEAMSEYIENCFVEGKGVPVFLQPPLRMLAKVFGIKTQKGNDLKTAEDLMESKERVIGAINVGMSYVAFADTALQTVKNIIHRGHPPRKHGFAKTSFKYLCDFVLPLINALLMWSSSLGKKHIANAIQQLAPSDHNGDVSGFWKTISKEGVNGAMTSANQDWICGINSSMLAVRKFIEKFVNHNLGKILEPIFAIYMSLASYREGQKALKGVEEDDSNTKYELAKRDKSALGHELYNFAKEISRIFNVRLPELKILTQ